MLEQLGWKQGGYFVEFGATDGVLLSNSWLLEKHFGWRGICAEPNPKLFERLQQNRSCSLSPACVYRSSGERMRFVLADAYGGLEQLGQDDQHVDKRNAYAAVGDLIEVTTTSLMDLLDQQEAPVVIDYLSIDTEGRGSSSSSRPRAISAGKPSGMTGIGNQSCVDSSYLF